MKVAVYSGSFNPLHTGHLAILKHLNVLFDRVLLLVSPKNPLKDNISEDSAQERLENARNAISRISNILDKVEVSDFEFHMPIPSYSIDTLRKLKETMPDDEFSIVMGGDQIADIRRWKEYQSILLDFGAYVFPREGFNIREIRENLLQENPDYRISIIDMELVNVSSTMIREALDKGLDVSDILL